MSERATDTRAVIARLSVRDRMTDFRYFVGRDEAVHSLIACATGAHKRSAVWIHGPRRMGKSSLAWFLAMEAQRSGACVIWVEAGDLSPSDFDGLLERAVTRAVKEIAIEPGLGSPRARFEALAEASKDRPVLIVFDEFDHMALNLQTTEQAFFRRLKSENDLFCYIFVTRIKPALLVEEVPDQNSRLLAICNHHRIRSLSHADVVDLCRRVGEDLAVDNFAEWAAPVFAAVGGYSYAVTLLAKQLAVASRSELLTPEAALDVIDVHRQEITADMSFYWGDLLPGTRAILLGEAEVDASSTHSLDARADGYYTRDRQTIRPKWLLEVGRSAGLVPAKVSATDPVIGLTSAAERLRALIHAINTQLSRRGLGTGFDTSVEEFRYFFLTRAESSKASTARAVSHLASVLVDGSRGAGRQRPGLPQLLADTFESSAGYRALLTLRNALTSNSSLSSERAVEVAAERTELYNELCGCGTPQTPEQWASVRSGLMDMLLESLMQIEQMSKDPSLRRPVSLVYVCADEDQKLCAELDSHLGALKHRGLIEVLASGGGAGVERATALKSHIKQAEIVVFLLSASFLGSAGGQAVLEDLEVYNGAGLDQKRKRYVPVLLRDVLLDGLRFEDLQILPRSGRPVTSSDNHDEAWKAIAGEIGAIAQQLPPK